ncbi:efflux RND transporter periplasmic adaptor subunit [Baaleninema sp.]|uniref:efflux RND transporter periplasmic adaptor subunit n=1 Tax=Baaleninema sp. TaxID=3101197 RepID=UPI003D04D3BE
MRGFELRQAPSTLPISKTAIALISLALLGLGGSIGYALVRRSASSSEPAAVTEVQPPRIETVTAMGWIDPKGETIDLSASQSAEGSRVDRLLVSEGDWVEVGQIVAILDSHDRKQAALDRALADVEIARAELAQVEAGAKTGEIRAQAARFDRNRAELHGQIATQRAKIASLQATLNGERRAQRATVERLQAELRVANKDCQRYEQLYRDGAVSEQDRDRTCLDAVSIREQVSEAQANLDRIVSSYQAEIAEAQANLDRTISTVESEITEAEATLDAVAEVRPQDLRLAEAKLMSAQAAVTQAEADLELSVVRSPQAGRVLEIYTHSGETIAPEGIVKIGQTDDMTVVAEVYESDVRKVQPGQSVTITSDALPQDLKGTVERVGWQVLRQSELDLDPASNVDARVVEVRIALDENSSAIAAPFTNLHVIAEIALAEDSEQ